MARPLRIAVWYNLPSGGARRALFDQVQGLLRRGHHVEVWRPATDAKKGGFADLGAIVAEHEVPLAVRPFGEKGWWAHQVRPMRHRAAQMAGMVEHSEACAREIEAGGFDLLYAHNDTLYNAPFIGRAVKGIPKVLYLQEPHRALYEALPDYPWAAHVDRPRPSRPHRYFVGLYVERGIIEAMRVQAREEAANAKAFGRVLVNSYYSRESVLKAYGREGLDVRVCYLGLDLDRLENLRLPRERFVVGLGAIVAPKNLEGAIRAVGTIPAERRPPLVWIGNFVEGPYLPRMEALAKELGVELRMRIGIPDAELNDLLSRAGAMVYSPWLEPFGYAPLEANACGLAVAAVAEGGVRETVVDGVTGVLAAPQDDALGRAVEAVLADLSLGERAERHVRANWGLEGSIDEVERNLCEVAGG